MDLTVPPISSFLPNVRHTAARALHGLDREVVGDVLLALDEAVTNAIRHGSRAGRPVRVSLGVADDWIEMAVRDHGPTAYLPRLPIEPPPSLSVGGRGLWLILQLVDEVRLERVGQGTLLALRRRAATRVRSGA